MSTKPWRRWFIDLPIRRKLQLQSTLISLATALVVSGVYAGYRLMGLRADYLANALATTEMVATNSIGAVAFNDATAAKGVLASLRPVTIVTGAAIDLPDHRNFAVYGTPAAVRLPEPDRFRFDGWLLYTAAPIRDDSTTGATLQVACDLHPVLWAVLRAVLLAFVLALLLALALSLFISNLLRRLILRPILTLHAATQRVGETFDYSHRAPVVSADELGELTTAFNAMLDRIQSADAALRTTNESLTNEIAERKRLQHALVETSRQAGMAEVATGILHNVGNVLNSVNISAQLMRENVERSQLRHFVRAADLIKQQGDGFPRYVAEDQKGRMLPPFLISLASALQTEHAGIQKELDHLTRNVEHIKEIVAAQQSFAKSVGVSELVEPRNLFDEAERIAQASVLRHGIEIRREYADVPQIQVDRHRALQILVNFVTNAIHAVKPNAPGRRQITLTLAATADGVAFTVADNGVGIAPENLRRIFTHGFTTRRDGHGFGLHSGALAARLLQGQVRVHSDGIGHGAQFTLELPSGAAVHSAGAPAPRTSSPRPQLATS
jgi:signal transduction histidine kinase